MNRAKIIALSLTAALLLAACFSDWTGEEQATVTLYFGGSPTSRAAVHPYTPLNDANFHSKIYYDISFFKHGDDPSTTGVNPVVHVTPQGASSVSINVPQGQYDVYVGTAMLGLDGIPYADMDPSGTNVIALPTPHYEIDTTTTNSISISMKVVTPVFYDTTDFGAITTYINSATYTAGDDLYMAYNLDSTNWPGIISAIGGASKFVHLNLTYCTTGGMFDPSGGNPADKVKVKEITLPKDAARIKEGSAGNPIFTGFTNLEIVNASSVTGIVGDFAFTMLTNLKIVYLSNASEIGTSAFETCGNLTDVDIYSALKIGAYAFNSCSNLVNVDISSATQILGQAFQSCISITSLDISNVPSIGDWAFNGCTNLTSLGNSNVLDKLTVINQYVFQKCNFATLELPNVTTLNKGAFASCTSLSTLKIPNVASIGDETFCDTGATALTIEMGTNQPSLGTRIFYKYFTPAVTKNVTVKVPSATTSYDATWKMAFSTTGGGYCTVNPFSVDPSL